MKTINLYEAKTHLSKLIAEIEAEGERVILCRNGVPVADLVRHQPSAADVEPDPELAGARYVSDPCAPLDESDWPEALR